MKISKSILFRSAHAIFKMQNVTFSEALTLAWEKTKQGVKAIVMKCNRQVKSERWIGYETVYFNELVFQSIVVSRGSVNNSGARHDYGIGAYNGD